MNWLQPPETVRRFTPHQIVQHVAAIIAWLALTLTALLSSAGIGWGRIGHLLAAAPAAGFLAYHVLFLAVVGIRWDVPAGKVAFLPWGDEWAVLRGRRSEGPGTGKFAPPEKADYLGILAWSALAALSGLLLRWPSVFRVPSLAAFGWIKTVHAGAGAALAVHVLTAHVRYRWFEAPPAFRMAILTGSVPLPEAEKRPGWIEDLVAGAVLVPEPVRPVAEDQEESMTVRELLERGNRHAREGDYGMACDAFAEALRLLPDYSQARFNLAVALFRRGDADGAREQLRIFIEMDPFNPMAEKAREMLRGEGGGAGGGQ
ncbi:MAG TPA: tetratricopeptide repeat protein [Candidatus Deferrimicrobiaceae bacterium]